MTFTELRNEIVTMCKQAMELGMPVTEVHGVVSSVEPELRYLVIRSMNIDTKEPTP